MAQVYVFILLLIAFAFGVGVLWGEIRVRSARRRGIYPAKGQATMNDVKRLALNGEAEFAIRAYREIYGVNVRKAKDAVDKIVSSDKKME